MRGFHWIACSLVSVFAGVATASPTGAADDGLVQAQEDGADGSTASPTAAVRRTRDKRSALIYGPLATPVSRSDVQALLDGRLGADLGMPARVSSLDEIPFPMGDPLWVIGGEDDAACETGEAAPDWAGVIDTARDQLDELDTLAAQNTLDAALENLACADSVVEREVLGGMYMLRGLARYYEEREEAARQDFRRAVTVNPGIEWDPDYPPEPQQVYLKAREDIYLPGRGRIEAVFLRGEVNQVVVDGQSVAAGEAGGLDVHPGFHLLQYMMPDQDLRSRVTYLEGGETRLLISRAGMEQAVLLGGSQPANAPVARLLLNQLCAVWSVDNIYVADVTAGARDEAYVYRFAREGARFERLLAPADASAEVGQPETVPTSAIEGLLVLPNAVAEGATSTITVESAQLGESSRLYLGPYEVQNLIRVGVRSTFNPPDKIPAGVYDMRIVGPDGAEVTFPRAFSVIGETRTAPAGPAVVYAAPPARAEPAERLRLGFAWGFASYRGTWATMDLEMDVRLGEGFCLDGGIGTRMVEGYYPHGYWRAGFKLRWYPRIVQVYVSINFQQFFEDLHMGPRGALGVDIVIPSMKNFYLSLETGGGAMFESAKDVYGWYHLMGGTGMRF